MDENFSREMLLLHGVQKGFNRMQERRRSDEFSPAFKIMRKLSITGQRWLLQAHNVWNVKAISCAHVNF